MMEVQVSVRNLSKSTTLQQLTSLFEQAGDVSAVRIIKDRKTGLSQGFAFVTMSAQTEADKAVSMFNSYVLDDQSLKVELVRPREQRGLNRNY